MKKHIKKIILCSLVGINLAFGAVNVVSADTGVMQRLEKIVTRMEKASANMPTHFQKSTLVDIKDAKMINNEYGSKEIIGKITNKTGADLSRVTLIYETMDKNGNVLKYESTAITQKIKNGGTIDFIADVMNEEKAVSFKLKSVQVEAGEIEY